MATGKPPSQGSPFSHKEVSSSKSTSPSSMGPSSCKTLPGLLSHVDCLFGFVDCYRLDAWLGGVGSMSAAPPVAIVASAPVLPPCQPFWQCWPCQLPLSPVPHAPPSSVDKKYRVVVNHADCVAKKGVCPPPGAPQPLWSTQSGSGPVMALCCQGPIVDGDSCV